MPALIKRKKLHAATAVRRSRAGMPEIGYEEMGEPNMKLSRALLIVLLLHVIAVAGIIAFNTIKTREAVSVTNAEPVTAASVTPATVAADSEITPGNNVTKVVAKTETTLPEQTIETPKKPSSAEVAAPSRLAEKTTRVIDSGKIYTVVRGDNPVSIAKRFHVSYDALLELNQISDPRKLRIGTKLHIPQREEPTRHKTD